MNRRYVPIALILIVAISLAAGYLLGRSGSGTTGHDDDDDGPDRLVELDGERALRLTPEDRARGGIELIEAEPAVLDSETGAIGVVVDVRPLLEFRSSLAALRAERETAQAIANNAAQTLDRARALHEEDGNISTRQLQAAEVEHEAAVQRRRALEIEADTVHSSALLQWGPVLAEWALAESSADFARILAGDDALLLVTLTGTASLADGVTSVHVNRDDKRTHAREASLISPAPGASPQAPGETWYFRTAADGLRAGMRLQVWIPSGRGDEPGVRLPSRAVVWHAGRAWVWLARTEHEFVRRPVRDMRPLGDGWFTADRSLEGRELVGTGAQMLLSEEFRRHIPDEDDDP